MKTVLLDRTNTAGKEPKELFLLCYRGAGVACSGSQSSAPSAPTYCLCLSRAVLPQAFKPDLPPGKHSDRGWVSALSAMLLLC